MGNNPSHFKGATNPVERVSWNDSQDFLNKLNGQSGKRHRFTLPTEAEWEYACRAGSTTRYYFGDDESQLVEYAWRSMNSEGKSHPVGQKKPNAWGLYDMHGNVWEWCADWYDHNYYAKSPTDDPVGPSTGSHRVFRGGSWRSFARNCRSACRGDAVPEYCDYRLGFRVARILAEK